MRTLMRNKQAMKYSLQDKEITVYETDENGNIIYQSYTDSEGNEIFYLDDDGNKMPIETGEKMIGYSEPVSFLANINNKLDEVTWREYGIDDTTKFAQLVVNKDELPLKVGSIIWKNSEVGYKDGARTTIDETSCDYTVKGVADEGLSVDLFLLQRNLK